jgi:AraC-like DNA-binding protein
VWTAAEWGGSPTRKLVGLGSDRQHRGERNHLATTQFKSYLGVTPKRVARIYRFARLILSVDALHPVDWSELAHAAGYYDQAHFSKEFKDFTGLTPTAYLTLRRRFPAERGFPPDNGPMPAD